MPGFQTRVILVLFFQFVLPITSTKCLITLCSDPYTLLLRSCEWHSTGRKFFKKTVRRGGGARTGGWRGGCQLPWQHAVGVVEGSHKRHHRDHWRVKERMVGKAVGLYSFLFCLSCGVPGPGIRSQPQSRPKPQLWQYQILNPLCQVRDRTSVSALPRHGLSHSLAPSQELQSSGFRQFGELC